MDRIDWQRLGRHRQRISAAHKIVSVSDVPAHPSTVFWRRRWDYYSSIRKPAVAGFMPPKMPPKSFPYCSESEKRTMPDLKLQGQFAQAV